MGIKASLYDFNKDMMKKEMGMQDKDAAVDKLRNAVVCAVRTGSTLCVNLANK